MNTVRLPVPQALLFDMDGVLADVRASYRRAIRDTAASFGIELDDEAITRAKRAGRANNDWELTHRLLAQAGRRVEYAEVKDRFEMLYQGNPAQPGLYRHEGLIPPKSLLEELARRIPLAIVTGRPRSDAVRFLTEHEIAGWFAISVCMEDAPLKPDPAPCHNAMAGLGVCRAWMIGDTPDDMRSACGAGAIGLGILAPGDEREGGVAALRAAGAAHILESLSELPDLLHISSLGMNPS